MPTAGQDREDISVESFLSHRTSIKEVISGLKTFVPEAESTLIERARDRNFLPELIRAYMSESLMLVLGAGASAERGLLTWNLLLQDLLLETIRANANENTQQSKVLAWAFQRIFSPNPLVAARYLKNFHDSRSSDPLSFFSKVRKTLYRDIRQPRTDGLLAEIRRLCMAVGRSPNLRGVISYNFDDLLEQELTVNGDGVKFTPIYSPGAHAPELHLPIFHVHGYLPQDGDLSEKNSVIFSEELYHKQYGEVYHWSNLIQINAFAENSCLFVGTSLTDPNQRRLLDIAQNLRGDKEIHHYCIRRRYRTDEIQTEVKWLARRNAEFARAKVASELSETEVIKHLIRITQIYETDDAASFGVGLIWVNEYSDYSEILKRMREGNPSEMPTPVPIRTESRPQPKGVRQSSARRHRGRSN